MRDFITISIYHWRNLGTVLHKHTLTGTQPSNGFISRNANTPRQQNISDRHQLDIDSVLLCRINGNQYRYEGLLSGKFQEGARSCLNQFFTDVGKEQQQQTLRYPLL